MTIDARAIANFVLGEANRHDIPITNMAINKLVYFLHAEYLLRFDKPLISSKIEAWEHGPVIREVYNSFKTYN